MTIRYHFAIIALLAILTFWSGSSIAQIPLVYYDSVEVVRNGETLANPWAGGLNCPQFSGIDLNGDGVRDLVVFERNFYGAVKTFLNGGTPDNVDYKYAPAYQSRFPGMRNWMLLRDYNCDGKEDIFTSVPAGVAVYRNDTEPGGNLQFTLVTSLLQTIGLDGQTPLYVSPPDIPAIVDVDNDGDLDFLTFNILGSTVEYHKNLSMETFGNCDFLDYELKNACWGYFSEDGTNNTVTLFDTCENNVPDPEKTSLHAGSTILALDLNGNGVKDLVLGDITYTNMVMLTNGGSPTSSGIVAFDTAFPSNSVPVDLTVFPAGYYLDADNDGRKDLLVAPNNPNTSENSQNIWFYKNTGTVDVPVFTFQQDAFLQDGMVDAGERSFPVFFDANGDGLHDIVMGNFGYFASSGNYSSQLLLMQNTGTPEKPSFTFVTDDYQGLSVYGFDGIYPAFGDLDGDGDLDMIAGDEEGHLHFFRNEAGPGNEAVFNLSQPNYMGIDVGQSAKPQVIDVNRDGLEDLLVGERGGTISYFENTGTSESADFGPEPTTGSFGFIDVMPECCTGYSVPFMAEDSTGNYMLYVGSEQGKLYLFNNIEGNLQGAFDIADSLYLSAINVTVAGADINNDGRLEMIFGEYGGGVGLLKHGTPPGMGVRDYKQARISLDVFPNPASGHARIIITELLNKGLKEISLEIWNSMGLLISSGKTVASYGQATLQLDGLGPGIFYIRVNTGEGSGSLKLVIE